ncbi:SDR family NAD(P)-dependent oxidoreductase [Haloglycomyces albus]|uniref:SDR family NAD(P)-dependent oxidoreductase n=1 Tax=Haloglycomyces albus TaxID=526067 RepID=UPI00046D8157|nr:SDR family oxidoreductase [Haloglycomyces albus]
MSNVSDDRPIALVTGATAGIGTAFCRALAADGYRLVLSARNEERLKELAESFDGAEVLPLDLSTDDGMGRLERFAASRRIDMLVNNAGFGLSGTFLKVPAADEVAMHRLHTEAVLRGTLAVLPGMVERGGGRIVNTASVAAFFPGSTYAASKSWVVSFSQSVASEVAAHGVNVTALCPGFTRTEFHQRAGMNMSKLPEFMWLDADRVVKVGLHHNRHGKAVSVPALQYKAMSTLGRLLPMGLSSKVLGTISRRRVESARH